MWFFKKKVTSDTKNQLDPHFISLLKTFKPVALVNKEQTKAIIQVKDLTKKYFINRRFKNVLSNVNFTINQGEQVAILGANGAGKTTLLEILSGSVVPTSGKIYYDYDFKYSPQEQIGIQFQDATCPRGLKVFDIISFQNSINLNKISEVEIATLLKTFHLEHLLNRQASKLSGGQQQRLNVFLAVMSKPKILFLDELSTALDINAQL
jgi:ABC-2 type transport system ATP-binding protein